MSLTLRPFVIVANASKCSACASKMPCSFEAGRQYLSRSRAMTFPSKDSRVMDVTSVFCMIASANSIAKSGRRAGSTRDKLASVFALSGSATCARARKCWTMAHGSSTVTSSRSSSREALMGSASEPLPMACCRRSSCWCRSKSSRRTGRRRRRLASRSDKPCSKRCSFSISVVA